MRVERFNKLFFSFFLIRIFSSGGVGIRYYFFLVFRFYFLLEFFGR